MCFKGTFSCVFEGLFFQQYRTLLSKPRPPPRSSLCPPVSLNSLLQVAQAVGRCVLCRVVFVSLRYLGGALNKVQLHDLLILELSSFKKKLFLKLAKLLDHPATSLPGSPTVTQASGLMLQ